MDKTASIREIFSSIQGEGLYVGERQIFIRFANCNLACEYCDVEKNKKALNLTVKEIIAKVKQLDKNTKHKTISLTGGEPLLYWRFLKILLPRLKKEGFNIYLETNATLPLELKKIINFIDIVSADIKLPSVTNGKPQWKNHGDFLKIAIKKNVFVKTIVSDKLKMYDFKKATALLKKVNARIPFVIQPVMTGRKVRIGMNKLFKLQDYALKFLKTVLVIPQMHKILGAK